MFQKPSNYQIQIPNAYTFTWKPFNSISKQKPYYKNIYKNVSTV